MHARSAVPWAVFPLLLSACNPFESLAPTETEILRAGFVEPDRRPAPAPVFCYRTLAEADCFREPQAGERSRFVGGFLPIYVID